ncbi:hypothetical protein RB195_016362 [Necator americanus]|uniref:Uncharacterized protein n=1 Tax=Necator americanus TaxID=51031 RepID=A0ABR1E8T4_NECAM
MNFSWLPEWNPPDPIDEDSYIAFLISFGLLLFSLGIPMVIATVFSGYKRAHKPSSEEKPITEDLSQFDHIFDNDGIYRESRFDGMLNEDAADDVEIPSQSRRSQSQRDIQLEKKSVAPPAQKKHVGTQTEPLFAYGGERLAFQEKRVPVFELYDVQRTMELQDEFEQPRRDEFLMKGKRDHKLKRHQNVAGIKGNKDEGKRMSGGPQSSTSLALPTVKDRPSSIDTAAIPGGRVCNFPRIP